MLDQDPSVYKRGSEVPESWYTILFGATALQKKIGPDGHPVTGGDDLMPPMHNTRRMFAGRRVKFHKPLKVGDLIVHVDHGIGEFVGLKQLGTVSRPIAGSPADVQEFLEVRYHGDDKLFVPVERLDLIQKYTGGARPALDRLGAKLR